MKLLALLTLVAFAAARHSSSHEWHSSALLDKHITQSVYSSGEQYEYVYDGQLMSGIPQSDKQHSSTRITALVVFQFRDATNVHMFLKHVQMGSLNEMVQSPRMMQPFALFEEASIQPKHMDALKAPLRFTYINGMISDVQLDSREETWSANIKRSVLNMLQVNLKKERLVKEKFEQREQFEDEEEEQTEGVKKFDAFTSMEKSIEGECETEYTVVSLPPRTGRRVDADLLNVTRAINFEKCNRRPDIQYNFRFQTVCPTCEQRFDDKERMLRSSTIIRQNLIARRDRSANMIETSIVDSQYTLVPFTDDGSVIQVYVNQTLVLVRTRPIQSSPELQQPKESETDLIASLDDDIKKERFLMNGQGNLLTDSSYSAMPNKERVLGGIMSSLLGGMSNSVEEQAPLEFSKLVKLMRLFGKRDIKMVHEQYCGNGANLSKEEKRRGCDLALDAFALCGSKDCIDHLVEHIIKSHHHQPIKATLLLRKLTQVRTVSMKMIEKIWTIPSRERCAKSPMVCQSAYLAIGSLLHAVCAPNKDRLALHVQKRHDECPRDVRQQWVEMLVGKFNTCEDEVCKITLLKTFANAGIELSIFELEKIIKDRRQSPTVRVEAVLATRLLAPTMPRRVQKSMMPIFMNKLETPYVRMAAFSKIMQTQPDKALIDQLTISLNSEGNRQVSTFVYTSLLSLANSTQPCEKRVADDITLSLRHARSWGIEQLQRSSWFARSQTYSEYLNRGYQIDWNKIMNEQSIIPKDIAASLHLETANIWTRYVATIGFSQSNLDEYLRRVMRRSGHQLQSDILDVLSGESESDESSESQEYKPKFEYRGKLNKLFKDLEIASRESSYTESDKQLLANVYLRFFDQDYMFMSLTKDMLPKYIRNYLGRSGEDISMETIVEKAGKYLKDVTLPFSVQSATHVFESDRKIYTSFGMPLLWSCRAPTIAQASGMIKFNFNKQERLAKFDVEAVDFNPSFSLSVIDVLETWSPVLNSGVKLVANVKVHAPFDGQVSIDLTKTQPQIKFTWTPKKRSYELVKVTTKPMTTVLQWPATLTTWQDRQDKIIQGQEWTRVHQIDTRIGRESLGTEVHMHGQWHYTPARKVSTTPFCFLAGPNKLAVHIRAGDQQPSEYTVILSASPFMKLDNKKMSPKYADDFFTESDEYLHESSESHSSSSKSSSAESNERDTKYATYAKQYKSTGVLTKGIKVQLLTKGSNIKRQLITTVKQSCTLDARACDYVLKVDAAPIPLITSSNWKLEGKLSWLYPKPAYKISQLIDEAAKAIVKFDAKWGTEDEKKQTLDGKIVGEQSDELKELIKESVYYLAHAHEATRNMHKSHFSPVAQYEHTVKYGLLDQYKMDIDYKVGRTLKNVTEKAFAYVKSYYFSQTEVDYQLAQGEKKIGQLTARVNIDPISRRYVNVTVQTPTQRTRLYDLPVYTSIVAPLNVRRVSTPARTIYGLLNEYATATPYGARREPLCEIRSDRVQTFDGLRYSAPVSTCFSLVTKDCKSSETSRFGIYIKREEQTGEKKVLKIVARNVKLVVRLGSGGKIECSLNNKAFEPCEQVDEVFGDRRHSLLRVQTFDNSHMKISLPEQGVRIHFDGYALNVAASTYEEHLCGMCGDADEQMDECELRTAQGVCVDVDDEEKVRAFRDSYVVREECSEDAAYWSQSEHYTRRFAPWDTEVRLGSWGKCSFCKGVISVAKKVAGKCHSGCEKMVESALHLACKHAPFFQDSCNEIADHADDVINWLHQGRNTKQVCRSMHMC